MMGQSYRRFTLAYLMILGAAAAGGLALIRWHLHLKSGATGSAQVAPTAAASPSSAVSVKDFGAKGDGVTDDAAAIQAAVDSLPASGGTVFVPAGDYRVSTSVVLGRDNISLVGQGASSVLRSLPSETLFPVILLPDSPVKNVTISNLVADGNHNPISGQCGIWIQQGSYVTISGVIVRNISGDGIQVANGSNPNDHVTIKNCQVAGIHRNGIHIGDATNTTIEDNYITDTPSQYWGGAAGCGIDVEVEGYNAKGTNPYGDSSSTIPFVDTLLIKDNVIERQDTTTSSAGVALQPAYGPVSNVTITGNLFSNHQSAVLGGGHDPYYGTTPALDHVMITNNWVDTPSMGVAGIGFYFNLGATDLTITNNVVHDQIGNFYNGVCLSDVVNATVSGNTFMKDRNGYFISIAVLGASNNVTLSKNLWQDSLDPVTPYSYLQVDPTVTNLTDDGGTPIDPSAVDKTPPAVSLGIASGTVISSPTPITVKASDAGSGVARVYLFVDGIPEGFSDSGSLVFTFDPNLYSAGPHVLEALAVDQSANVSAASQVSVRVG